MNTHRALGEKRGRAFARIIAVGEIRDYADEPHLWCDAAIESAFMDGYESHEARGADDYVDGYIDAANDYTVERVRVEFF